MGALAGITIPAGGSSATGTIATTDDAADHETFTMALDGNLPSLVTAGTPTSVTLTITDDGGGSQGQSADPTVSLSAAPNPVAEGSPVRVTAALSSDVTIPLTPTADMAEEDDFGALASITINAESTTGSGTVTTNQDTDTGDETFTVALDSHLPLSVAAGTPS